MWQRFMRWNWTGAKPVFVDCETTTGNMDPVLLEKAITFKTKAVFVVHFAAFQPT